MDFHGPFDVVVSVDSYGDVVHHLEIFLLTQLLNLGNQLSCQALVHQLIRKGSVQDGEHVVFHGYGEAFFGVDSDVEEILGDFNVFAVKGKNRLSVSFNRSDEFGGIYLGKSRSESFYLSAEHRSSCLEVRLQREVHILVQVFLEHHFLDVQFLHDERRQVAYQRFVFSVYDDFAERLSYLDLFLFSRSASESCQRPDEVHSLFYVFIHQAHIRLREICRMNGRFSCQIYINLVGNKRRDRCYHLGHAY